jgi:hypothetical protein
MDHSKEILTDNTRIKYCEQCEKCTLWGIGGDPFSNAYDKANCAMYPSPDHKPGYVINNQAPCPFRVAKE